MKNLLVYLNPSLSNRHFFPYLTTFQSFNVANLHLASSQYLFIMQFILPSLLVLKVLLPQLCLTQTFNETKDALVQRSSIWSNGRTHLCSLVDTNRTELKLQAFTMDKDTVYLIESDYLYLIPKENLNETEGVLYMYNKAKESSKLYPSEPWFENSFTKLHTDEMKLNQFNQPKQDKKRYEEKNKFGTLKRFHLFLTSLNKTVDKKVKWLFSEKCTVLNRIVMFH